MLKVAREQAPNHQYVQGRRLDLPFEDSFFDRVFTSYFYCHLKAGRATFSHRARRVASELVVVGTVVPRRRAWRRWADRVLVWPRAGKCSSASLSPSWRRARRPRSPPGPPLRNGRGALARRRSSCRSISSLQRDNRVCRACAEGRISAFLPAGRPAVHGPARVHPRTGARGRRGRAATAVARPRRADAPPLARAGRGRLLRDLLLRVGHALLPEARSSKRRPDAGSSRAGAPARSGANGELRLIRPELVLVVRRALRPPAARPEQPRQVDRPTLRARWSNGDPAAPPVRNEPLG